MNAGRLTAPDDQAADRRAPAGASPEANGAPDAVGLFQQARSPMLTGALEELESRQRTNVAGIDFVSLRLVVVCAETRSLSAATRHLNLSLSAGSHRLSTLEEMFGTRFFERDHRGLHPTPAGAVFVRYARPILDLLRSCRLQVAIAQRCETEQSDVHTRRAHPG